MNRSRHVPPHFFALMTALAGLFASVAVTAPARAQCTSARAAPSVASLPEPWRAAVVELLSSTVEPGHPWSCSGGTIALELDAVRGALLVVKPDGEEPVKRHVAEPDDVLPLGQALLAMPLPRSSEQKHADGRPAEPSLSAPVPAKIASAPETKPKPSQRMAEPRAWPAAQLKPSATGTSNDTSRRLLLGAGIDGRYVGGSNVGWLGPTGSAGLVIGRWLPSISVRQHSAIVHDGPSADEVSFAATLQSRIALSRFELRPGLVFRGAAVLRDLPRPLGQQSRLEGRIGAVTSFVIPVFSWASVVLSADADVVAISREATAPETSTADESPTPFPTYTLGGSAWLEFPL